MSDEQPNEHHIALALATGRRFLPVPAALWPPTVGGAGLVELLVAPGTPVHATAAGRVVEASGGLAGELVIRDEDQHLVHYRRLLPSSIRATEGDRIAPGEVLGVANTRPEPDGNATVLVGIKSADGAWMALVDVLLGAADPDELFLPVPRVVDDPLVSPAAAPAPAVARDRSRPAVAPTTAPGEQTAKEPAGRSSTAGRGTSDARHQRRPVDPKRIAAGVAGTPPPRAVPTPPPATGTADPTPGTGAVEPDPTPPVVAETDPAPPADEPIEPDPTPAPAVEPGDGDAAPEGDAAPSAEGAEPAAPQEVFRKLAGRTRRKDR